MDFLENIESKKTTEIIKEAETFYFKNVFRNKFKLNKIEDEKMAMLPDLNKLTNEQIRSKMNYYNSWLAYFQRHHSMYKWIYEILEECYKDYLVVETSTRGDKKKYELEAQVKVKYRPMLSAIQLCRGKSESFKNHAKLAEQQLNTLQQVVIVQGIERKSSNYQ